MIVVVTMLAKLCDHIIIVIRNLGYKLRITLF